MVIVVAAIAMVAVLAIVAIVLDLGYARQEAEETQIATDAAALAGSRELPASNSAAIAASLNYVVRGLARSTVPQSTSCREPFPATVGSGPGQQQTECYVVGGDYLEITANYNGATRMRVEAQQATPTFFGGAIEQDPTTVVRAAVAQREPAGAAECGLCVLGGVDDPPYDGQNGDFVVRGDAGAAINGGTGRVAQRLPRR